MRKELGETATAAFMPLPLKRGEKETRLTLYSTETEYVVITATYDVALPAEKKVRQEAEHPIEFAKQTFSKTVSPAKCAIIAYSLGEEVFFAVLMEDCPERKKAWEVDLRQGEVYAMGSTYSNDSHVLLNNWYAREKLPKGTLTLELSDKEGRVFYTEELPPISLLK